MAIFSISNYFNKKEILQQNRDLLEVKTASLLYRLNDMTFLPKFLLIAVGHSKIYFELGSDRFEIERRPSDHFDEVAKRFVECGMIV
jgi:hypothetical protein